MCSCKCDCECDKPKELDLSRPLETLRGDPVRILATDIKGPYPLAIAFINDSRDEHITKSDKYGKTYIGFSIRNKIEEVIRYSCVSPSMGYETISNARFFATNNAAGTEKRTFRNGKLVKVEIVD